MTVIEYFCRADMNCLVKDEYKNIYIYYTRDSLIDIRHLKQYMTKLESGLLFMTKEDYSKLSEFNISIDADADFPDYIRRPFYYMRGKPVTEEQAFEIIRRTDDFFGDYRLSTHNHKDYLGGLNFYNCILKSDDCLQDYGWMHINGEIGIDTTTGKYPTADEILNEWIPRVIAFPYLDLIIALTYWNEYPSTEDYSENLYDAIVCGVAIHDKSIELINASKTVSKFKEYDALYGKSSHVSQISMGYLKKCIEAYGFDADTELSKLHEYKNIFKEGDI